MPRSAGQQSWLAAGERKAATDGRPVEFPLPNPNSGPTTLALAPDGTSGSRSPAVTGLAGSIRTGQDSSEFPLPHPDSSPRIIALGSDGNMWFSEHTGNRMGRIAPTGEIAEFAIPTPKSMPRAIALGGDGNIWFGEFAAGKIGRMTPKGVITEFPIPTPDSGPRALAAGPDGNIWFSEFNAGKIGRITPAGVITEFPLPRPNRAPATSRRAPTAICGSSSSPGSMDGRTPDGNRVGRITMAGWSPSFRSRVATGSPINIAVGPDRNIWFTKGSVARPRRRPTERSPSFLTGTERGGDRPDGGQRPPAADPSGQPALWFTLSGANRIAYLEFK